MERPAIDDASHSWGCGAFGGSAYDDDVQQLAEEVGLSIFAHLDPLDLLRSASAVCRQFHRWAHDPALWRRLLAQELYAPPCRRPSSPSPSSTAPSPLLIPSLPFFHSIPPPHSQSPFPSAPIVTYEDWWRRWRALDRRTHQLQRLLTEAAPQRSFFRIHANARFLPPSLAPLACLTSTTYSSSSSSSATPAGVPPGDSVRLFPRFVVPPPSPPSEQPSSASPSSPARSPRDMQPARAVSHLEDLLEGVLDFAEPELRQFRDGSAVEGWFGLQLIFRLPDRRSVDAINAALRSLFPSTDAHPPSPSPSSPPDPSATVPAVHALYYVQQKHDTASGILILHHDINALVFVHIGDFD